jgi:hypothetical protein
MLQKVATFSLLTSRARYPIAKSHLMVNLLVVRHELRSLLITFLSYPFLPRNHKRNSAIGQR